MIKTSANDILLYEFCPRKWELAKLNRKEKKQIYAFYRFSSALHFATNKYISEMENIFDIFEAYWGRYENGYPLIYKKDESWLSLKNLGIKFLEKFRTSFESKGISPILAERRLRIVTDKWEFTGQLDFIGYKDKSDSYVVMDYKTTETRISDIWVRGSDQMTASAMLVVNEFMVKPPVDILICNFVKAEEDVIWIESIRTAKDINEYVSKINHYIPLLDGLYHPRRSLYAYNSPCTWCEFIDGCYDENRQDRKETKDSLSEFAFQ